MKTSPLDSQPNIIPVIISETEDYLVINKPAGLAVHAGGNLKEPTLTDWLIEYYPDIKTVGDDPIRPGLVHRLDKEVSGLMVIAKNQKSFLDLKQQFKDRTIHKEYLALAHGQISADTSVINFPITRSQSGHKMAALPIGSNELLLRQSPRPRDQGNIDSWFKAREAETEFVVLQRFVNFTLIRVRIKTGRTHQIRVHLFAYGHPLAGDPLYFTKKLIGKNKKLNLNRVWLVADHLAFKDLKGETQDFTIPTPEELLSALPKH
jgi:23S rRNA pseudouridine1911/1915/1917 synthase